MRKITSIVLLSILLFACSNSQSTSPVAKTPTSTITSTVEVEPTSTPTSIYPPTAQPLPFPTSYGPDDFPEGFNPLTGQPMIDQSWVNIPALLLSVSHFPPVARPQSGFSFTPFVYEYYITEGATRHLAVFYGEFPKP